MNSLVSIPGSLNCSSIFVRFPRALDMSIAGSIFVAMVLPPVDFRLRERFALKAVRRTSFACHQRIDFDHHLAVDGAAVVSATRLRQCSVRGPGRLPRLCRGRQAVAEYL